MGNSSSSVSSPSPLLSEPFNVSDIQGKWHVVATTFPMWLKGDKKNPTITYTNLVENQQPPTIRFDDTVHYTETNGNTQEILGFDIMLCPGVFRWQGKGWLFFFKSDWKFITVKDDWAVITFKSTFVTPAGMDIISRKDKINETEMQDVLKFIEKDTATNPFISQIKRLS
jgi:hypothetical protein